MGLYYNIQKSLLMIHQKTQCLTSDPQCMCGNTYNVSYSTSDNSKLLQQPASGSQIGTQTLIGTGNSKLKLATARVSDKQALLQEGRMGLHYNMQNCYNSSKFLLMIHQKTECITSDLQHICGNHYNVVMGGYYSTSCNNCFATTASLRFAD